MRLKKLLPQFLLPLMDVSIQFVPVLSDWELPIIINGNVDLLQAWWFVFWVMELSNVGVSQSLLSSESFVRVECHQVPEQVNSIITGCRKDVSQFSLLDRRNGFEHGNCHGAFNWVNIILGGLSYHLHYSFELVQGWGTREQWFAKQKLSQNTAHAPHVYTLSILVRAKENLWRPVPSGGNIISKEWDCISLFGIQRSCKTVISYFNMAFRVEKQVTWLQVSVK